jgi:hypothetical protein
MTTDPKANQDERDLALERSLDRLGAADRDAATEALEARLAAAGARAAARPSVVARIGPFGALLAAAAAVALAFGVFFWNQPAPDPERLAQVPLEVELEAELEAALEDEWFGDDLDAIDRDLRALAAELNTGLLPEFEPEFEMDQTTGGAS